MSERPAAVMETLLALHRQREPRDVLQLAAGRLAPAYGRAAAWCYLLDPVTETFRLERHDDADAAGPAALVQGEPRIPRTLAPAKLLPGLAHLLDTGAPVVMADSIPDFLAELWGAERTALVRQALRPRYCAVAPVVAEHGPAGVLLLLLLDAWPVDVAAEFAAHAALALAHLVDRRHAGGASNVGPATGLSTGAALERAAARELDRAERYRRMLSLVVFDLPEDAREGRLPALAGCVARVMRRPDTAGTIEHGQLVVLLPETPSGGAAVFARRVRSLAGPDFAGLRGAPATFPQDGRTWDELVTAAVARLDQPELPPVPGATMRGTLRAAFPTFGGRT